MPENFHSVGELSTLSGTTIRTLQYYDKIGLLIAERSLPSNIRRYTQDDLVQLQQILFYKKLGVPLYDIKKLLLNYTGKDDIKKVLNQQAEILFQKEMEIKMNMAIINAIVATIDADQNYDVEAIMKIALKLNKETILGYTSIQFDKRASALFEEKYTNYDEVVEIYWMWKEIVLEAISYKINEMPFSSDAGYQLGGKWHEFIGSATAYDSEMIGAYQSVFDQSKEWPEEDLFLYNFCKDFIENAHIYYCEKKGVSEDDLIT